MVESADAIVLVHDGVSRGSSNVRQLALAAGIRVHERLVKQVYDWKLKRNVGEFA